MQLGELVVSPDMGVVGRQRHEEVDEADDDEDAGGGGQHEHDLGVLHKVLAEHLDLCRALHLHMLALGAYREGRKRGEEIKTCVVEETCFI